MAQAGGKCLPPSTKHKHKNNRTLQGSFNHTHTDLQWKHLLYKLSLGQYSDTRDGDHHARPLGLSSPGDVCGAGSAGLPQPAPLQESPAAGRNQHVGSGSPHLRLTLRSRTCACQCGLPASLSFTGCPTFQEDQSTTGTTWGASAQPSWRWAPRLPFRCNVVTDSGAQKRGLHIAREGSVSSHLRLPTPVGQVNMTCACESHPCAQTC